MFLRDTFSYWCLRGDWIFNMKSRRVMRKRSRVLNTFFGTVQFYKGQGCDTIKKSVWCSTAIYTGEERFWENFHCNRFKDFKVCRISFMWNMKMSFFSFQLNSSDIAIESLGCVGHNRISRKVLPRHLQKSQWNLRALRIFFIILIHTQGIQVYTDKK